MFGDVGFSHSRDSGEGMNGNPQWQVVVVMESWWWFRGFFAPGAEKKDNAKQGTQRNKATNGTSGAKFNRVWHRKGSFETGMAHFGTEREPTDTHKKIVKHFPFS